MEVRRARVTLPCLQSSPGRVPFDAVFRFPYAHVSVKLQQRYHHRLHANRMVLNLSQEDHTSSSTQVLNIFDGVSVLSPVFSAILANTLNCFSCRSAVVGFFLHPALNSMNIGMVSTALVLGPPNCSSLSFFLKNK